MLLNQAQALHLPNRLNIVFQEAKNEDQGVKMRNVNIINMRHSLSTECLYLGHLQDIPCLPADPDGFDKASFQDYRLKIIQKYN